MGFEVKNRCVKQQGIAPFSCYQKGSWLASFEKRKYRAFDSSSVGGCKGKKKKRRKHSYSDIMHDVKKEGCLNQ
jgi:hypothetical protein